MRNIVDIADLNTEELEALFFAQKKNATAFVPMPEDCVVITEEGSSRRIDYHDQYLLAIGEDGKVWPVSKRFFAANYERLSDDLQKFERAIFLAEVDHAPAPNV